jgi:hypothetical protein
MAQPQSLSVFRGRSVEIPLQAQGRTPGQLKFLIRSRPSKGRLGEIRVTGPRTAVVTYVNDDESEGIDSFTFAVQAVDSPVSAPAAIAIKVSEEPPALSVVRSVDFGSVQVGETREEEITLRNSGGGVLEGRLDVTPPWKILGAAQYRLGRNQEMAVLVACAPDEEQNYSGKLFFSHDTGSPVELLARAESPFEFEPSREIELASQEGETARSGNLFIRNRTTRDRTGEISVPPEIASPGLITVPAAGEVTIALKTQPAFLGASEGVLGFESEGFRHSIPLRVFALQPLLRIEPREGFDFGTIEPGKRYTGLLRIKNEGGSSARLQATAPNEILLLPDPNSAVLQPGETRVFEIALQPSSVGDYQSQIVIDAGAGKPVSIDVEGRSAAQPPEVRKIPTATLEPAAREPPGAEPEKEASAIPPVTDIKVLKASNRVFEIGWQKPAPDPVTWVIQQHQFEMGEPPTMVWRDLRNIRFSEENGMAVARFENLAPGRVWLLRIVSIDEQGRRSAPSPTFKLLSAPTKPFPSLWWLAALLAIGGAVLGWTKIRERGRAEAAREADRIARIGGG